MSMRSFDIVSKQNILMHSAGIAKSQLLCSFQRNLKNSSKLEEMLILKARDIFVFLTISLE